MIPIIIPKYLTETARLLRQDFYFNKILDSWIKIKKEQNDLLSENNKLPLSENIQAINEFFTNSDQNPEFTLPIT